MKLFTGSLANRKLRERMWQMRCDILDAEASAHIQDSKRIWGEGALRDDPVLLIIAQNNKGTWLGGAIVILYSSLNT